MGRTTWFLLIFVLGFTAFVFMCFTAGYTKEKYFAHPNPQCINSACDQPCPKTFKRHVGACTK